MGPSTRYADGPPKPRIDKPLDSRASALGSVSVNQANRHFVDADERTSADAFAGE